MNQSRAEDKAVFPGGYLKGILRVLCGCVRTVLSPVWDPWAELSRSNSYRDNLGRWCSVHTQIRRLGTRTL